MTQAKVFSSLVTRSLGAACAISMMPAMAWAQSADPKPWQLNMGRGVTHAAQRAYDLNMWSLIVCGVIGLIVFGAMFYAMFKFRNSKGVVPATFTHNTTPRSSGRSSRS